MVINRPKFYINLTNLFLFRKVPYKLSSSRKRGIRGRLKNVENILNLLNSTRIKSTALVILKTSIQILYYS